MQKIRESKTLLKEFLSRKNPNLTELCKSQQCEKTKYSLSITLFCQKIRESYGFTKEVDFTKKRLVRENVLFFHTVTKLKLIQMISRKIK